MSESAAKPVFAAAVSERADIFDAVEQVAQALLRDLDGRPDLLIAFATADHRGTFDALQERLGRALRPRIGVGMTAEGVIGTGVEVERRPGLSVLAARLPGVSIEPFTYEQIDWQAVVHEPAALRGMIGDGREPKLIILLADPFSVPVMKMLPLFNRAFAGVPIVGGMASAGYRPGENRLLCNGRVMDQGAVGLVLTGPIDVRCIVSQGCRPIGRPMVITAAQRHLVRQLGGRNALEVAQEVVRGLDVHERKQVQSHGLYVGRVLNEYKPHFGRGDFLIRSISGIEEASGSIGIADTGVRVGQTIQFHLRDQHTAREDLALLLEGEKLHGPADGALLFSCNGRGTRLFDQPDVEAKLVQDLLGPVPLAGCFAAGEIGPIGEESFLHGHTASLVVFRGG